MEMGTLFPCKCTLWKLLPSVSPAKVAPVLQGQVDLQAGRQSCCSLALDLLSQQVADSSANPGCLLDGTPARHTEGVHAKQVSRCRCWAYDSHTSTLP